MVPSLPLNPAWSRPLVGAATVVLVVILGWMAAGLTWLVLEPDSRLARDTGVVQTPEATGGTGADEAAGEDGESGFARAARVALFGEPQVREEVPVTAPETRLRLRLLGVSSTAGDGGVAVISVNNDPAALYRPGDDIGDGMATVRRVEPHQVILERDGRFEALRLPRGEDLRGEGVAEGSRRQGADSRPHRGEEPAPRISRDRWMRDPQQLAEVVQAEPVMRGGRLHGIRVQPRRNQREFARAGLRPGDIITSIDGQAVGSIENPQSLVESLQGSSQINLVVERGGNTVPLTVELSD